jgi:hypothetical protein
MVPTDLLILIATPFAVCLLFCVLIPLIKLLVELGSSAFEALNKNDKNDKNEPEPLGFAPVSLKLIGEINDFLSTTTMCPDPFDFFDFLFESFEGWSEANVEALASFVASFLPKFARSGLSGSASGRAGTGQSELLAQTEATMHRPTGFASSPSLPGTISSPWWTDFSHLIYWFYFVATFATVAFLWYLYDFRVRRAETAHPIRETRGFSRAQTGDLVTAVLPLT